MNDRKKKRKKKKQIRLIHIVLIFAIAYISVTMLKQRRLMKDLQAKKQQIEGEIKTIETEINKLSEEIEYSDSLDFIEKVAREEHGMVKPREIIYLDKNKMKKSIFNVFPKGRD
ncbi:FtsB family cell division protein [Wansuia hejianensis]|uniref:Septum formation initiator family protein n=1 Tax=Wansuia hejianensis TaxID=2763667 RepID=A0A926EWN1_9FIRM|nr:septum formation initiator family protein [Wansuia hejianensis]MBC8591243.1 septum formation initiator family protein [Wansuia hejianensis]